MNKIPKRRNLQKRRHNLVLLTIFSLLVGSMLFYLWIYNYTNQLYRNIEQLRRQESNLVARNRMTMIEIEHLNRTDRIKNIAANEIEMVTPVPETLAVVIDPKTMVTR